MSSPPKGSLSSRSTPSLVSHPSTPAPPLHPLEIHDPIAKSRRQPSASASESTRKKHKREKRRSEEHVGPPGSLTPLSEGNRRLGLAMAAESVDVRDSPQYVFPDPANAGISLPSSHQWTKSRTLQQVVVRWPKTSQLKQVVPSTIVF